MKIPDTTTHVWTPAIERPYIPWLGIQRRAFFRNLGEGWQSFSNTGGCWMDTKNTPEWFTEEHNAGFLVTVEQFNSPDFVIVKEKV